MTPPSLQVRGQTPGSAPLKATFLRPRRFPHARVSSASRKEWISRTGSGRERQPSVSFQACDRISHALPSRRTKQPSENGRSAWAACSPWRPQLRSTRSPVGLTSPEGVPCGPPPSRLLLHTRSIQDVLKCFLPGPSITLSPSRDAGRKQ